MCQIDKLKKVDIGCSYQNDKSAVVFSYYISEVERLKLVTALNEAKFISVICDGSTDSAVQEQELVYIRYVSKGVVLSKFLGIKSVERGTGENIYHAIHDILNMDGAVEWTKKVVALGSDGAASMTSKNVGEDFFGDSSLVISLYDVFYKSHHPTFGCKLYLLGLKQM